MEELEAVSSFLHGFKLGFVYKVNTMLTVVEVGTMGKTRDVFLRVDIADHVVMVIMQCPECAGPWLGEWL